MIRFALHHAIATAALLPSLACAATLTIDTGNTRTVDIDDQTTATWYYGDLATHDLDGQAALRAKWVTNFGNPRPEIQELQPQEFWLAPPAGYDPADDDGQRHPLVIYLHGAGSRGEQARHLDNAPLTYWNRPDVQAAAPGGGAFVMAPQVRVTNHRWVEVGEGTRDFNVDGYDNDDTTVAMSLRLALTAAAGIVNGGASDFATRIDPDRVYIVGQSMGGFGVWDAIARVSDAGDRSELEQWLAAEHANGGDAWDAFQFAGAMTSSGAAPLDRGLELASLPIWAQAHLGDTLVPGDGTLNALQAIRDALNDPHAVYQTTPATRTADGSATAPIDETLAELLAYKHLFTAFEGDVPDDFLGGDHPEHSWAVNDAMALGEETLMAEWLFAQAIPTPASIVPMLIGAAGLLLVRRRR
ncbi:MAG: hypothetical protein WD534_08405 [Phycisphaeraceae bacterium]